MATLVNPHRRRFLGTSGRIALGSACALSLLGRLELAQAASPATGYRALVCVYLFGGNDSGNMVVPMTPSAYGSYAAARPSIALPREQLLPIRPTSGGQGIEWGLHPALPELATLFERGDAALVANLGPLVQPTTAEDFRQQRVPLPPELFSHVDQQAHSMSLGSETQALPGWGGRIADRLAERFADQRDRNGLPISISLAGSNAWQNGSAGGLYTLGSSGVTRLDASLRPGPSARWTTRRNAFDTLLALGQQDDSVFVREAASTTRRARDFAESVNAALAAVTLQTAFPTSGLGQSLRTIARVIGARQALGQSRQVFFVGIGGWDMHDNLIADHQNLLRIVSQALAAFQQATGELGVADAVTTFTMTDFGRNLNNNGDGSDHGWGGHSWVLGGGVAGGRFHGQINEYALGSSLDVGRGRIVPTTSIDQFGAGLAHWMGLAHGDLDAIFPNLRNFPPGLDGLFRAGAAPALSATG
jgi:uncharacterized protein (DUF1501 family)